MRIIQWNLNGFHPRKERLQLLIASKQPDVICLQETNFKNNHCSQLKEYSVLNKNRTNTAHASDGIAIYLKNNVRSQPINLDTDLEAVAATVNSTNKLSICNLYLPGSKEITKGDLDHLISQLPIPFIILGDLNGHNQLWRSKTTNNEATNKEAK